MKICFTIILSIILGLNSNSCNRSNEKKEVKIPNFVPSENLQKAYFASGCFWCVEAIFESVNGVEEVVSGYCGGESKNANYETVSLGGTKHAESVEVYYDPTKIDYSTLLKVFFESHDATTLNRQGPDAGKQYRSVIFYQNENEKNLATNAIERLYLDGGLPQGTITTELTPFMTFYPAENYHQNYEKLHPSDSYIKAVSLPRLKKFQTTYPELLKKGASH